MARSSISGIARLLAEALIASSPLMGLASCAEAKAVSTGGSRIDQVRLGFGLNLDGRVSPGCVASKFALGDPIHLSMHVTDAPPGSVVRVAVRDTVTRRIAWTEDRPVPSGSSYLTFAIGRKLAQGRYRTESTLGDQTTSPREFVVHVWNGNPL